jgi:hypothetical protein
VSYWHPKMMTVAVIASRSVQLADEKFLLRLIVKGPIAVACEAVPINMVPPPIPSCLAVANKDQGMDRVKMIVLGVFVSAPRSEGPIRNCGISDRYAARICLATEYHRQQGPSTAC